jgi:adenylosuccinate lyase
MADFDNYQSPFSWRYGSPQMRQVWGEKNKRLIWRRLWVAMAKAQVEMNLVTREQVQDLEDHALDVDVPRALEIEKINHHDLMAELKVFAEQCPIGGPILHLGATSMDIKDNAEVLQIRESLRLVLQRLAGVLKILAEKIDLFADLPVMAFTHLQPAEPTTLGYRLAGYAQDLLKDYENLETLQKNLWGKGFKGAVGNAASYVMLYGMEGYSKFETAVSQVLNLPFFEVTSQTYTRKQDYEVISTLAGLAATLHKFAFDLRILQSEVIGEMAEPFGEEQVGSSAMPFKRNPVECEKIDSLARAVAAAPLTAWGNYANSLLERTLDDSANRRTLFPETFLAVDEMLLSFSTILEGLKVNFVSIQENLKKFGPFSAVERILMAMVKKGANRQEAHEILRQLSMSSWQEIQKGKANPLVDLMQNEAQITNWIQIDELQKLFTIEGYTGIAESRAQEIVKRIRILLKK